MSTSSSDTVPEGPVSDLVVDDTAPDGDRGAASWITPAALLVGLVVTLLFTRAGAHFFFLPIIIPFGLGGGALARRLRGRFRRRVLRLAGARLSLVTAAPWGTSQSAALDTDGGVFVGVDSSGVWVNGVETASVRVVSRHGALSVNVAGTERARVLRQQLGALLAAARVPALPPTEPLAGGVERRRVDGGEELSFRAGRRGAGLAVVLVPIIAFVLLAIVVLPAVASGTVAGSGSLALIAFAVVAFLLFAVPTFAGLTGGGARRTVLRVGPSSWSLRTLSGSRVEASTGGPGALSATVVTARDTDPFGAGIARVGHVLELASEGEVVGVVGAELALPELHWLAERVNSPSR